MTGGWCHSGDGRNLVVHFWIPGQGRNDRPGTQMISSYKSRHCGLVDSISFSFQARCDSLIAFSRPMAESIVSCGSNQTRVWTPYFLVKRSTTSFLCCQMRWTRLEVGDASVEGAVSAAGKDVDAGLFHVWNVTGPRPAPV